LVIIPYDRRFVRDQFSCGKPSLDNYIARNAAKDVSSRACTCFVVIDEHKSVKAYYTLSAESVSLTDAPEELRRNIKYPHIPVILLGRLAVDRTCMGKGWGKILLIDALKKCMQVVKDQIGAVAVVVDPIDEEAESFYSKYGFTRLPDSGRMFMTMKKIEEAFDGESKR
jgi:predicted GNAT family N-acyltransferase